MVIFHCYEVYQGAVVWQVKKSVEDLNFEDKKAWNHWFWCLEDLKGCVGISGETHTLCHWRGWSISFQVSFKKKLSKNQVTYWIWAEQVRESMGCDQTFPRFFWDTWRCWTVPPSSKEVDFCPRGEVTPHGGGFGWMFLFLGGVTKHQPIQGPEDIQNDRVFWTCFRDIGEMSLKSPVWKWANFMPQIRETCQVQEWHVPHKMDEWITFKKWWLEKGTLCFFFRNVAILCTYLC